MSEAADIGSHFLTFALIAFYWALLSFWPNILLRGEEDNTGLKTASPAGHASSTHISPSVCSAFDAIRAVDQNFDEQEFMAGASKAYETVLGAYARADLETLSQLLDAGAFDDFARAIAERDQRREAFDLTFIGIKEATITEAGLDEAAARIDVRFTAEIATATRSAEGTVIDGDPAKIFEVREIWTFGRDLASTEHGWRLIATDEA